MQQEFAAAALAVGHEGDERAAVLRNELAITVRKHLDLRPPGLLQYEAVARAGDGESTAGADLVPADVRVEEPGVGLVVAAATIRGTPATRAARKSLPF